MPARPAVVQQPAVCPVASAVVLPVPNGVGSAAVQPRVPASLPAAAAPAAR